MKRYINKETSDVQKLINNQIITEDDIINIMKCNSNDIFLLMKQPLSITKKTLVRIYWNPEQLYDLEISERLTEALLDFVKYRYQNEIGELDERLANGFISREEHSTMKEKIESKFFKPTAYGNNIRRLIEKDPEPKLMRKIK